LFINRKTRELNLKIVYYGPALAGKTTNLQYIHAHTHPERRSDLVSIKTREDRTLFFDFMQLELNRIRGLRPQFSLYTVPGQVHYDSTRRLVLQGADGVVFVADSQRHRLADNLVSLAGLEAHVHKLGRRSQQFPFVLQCNKQDLPDALNPMLLKARLGRNGIPCCAAVAVDGEGVFDTLKAIVNRVVRQIR
jgi:signal recognition particle receptor subunit beta